MVYWVVCTGVAVMAVCTQVQDAHQASTAVRKTFHLLVLAVYLPGIAWECTLMHLASGIAFAALILTEVYYQSLALFF
jgi:dolichol kinase